MSTFTVAGWWPALDTHPDPSGLIPNPPVLFVKTSCAVMIESEVPTYPLKLQLTMKP